MSNYRKIIEQQYVANTAPLATIKNLAANTIVSNLTGSAAAPVANTKASVAAALIDDTTTTTNNIWSASKTNTEIQNKINGNSWKDAVKAASTQDLTSETFGATGVTYANGTLGVGATLTQDDATDGAFGSLDGIAITLNDRILIMDQTAGAENGIYELTTVGDGSSTPWVLTRVIDADTSEELDSATVTVQQGTTKGDIPYTQTSSAATIGTTSLTFVQINGAGSINAGDGLTKTGNTLNVGAGTGISVDANTVSVTADVMRLTPADISSSTTVASLSHNYCNTSGGAFTVFLPSSPTANTYVEFFLGVAGNTLTIDGNSNNILNGDTATTTTLSVVGEKIALRYNVSASTYYWF